MLHHIDDFAKIYIAAATGSYDDRSAGAAVGILYSRREHSEYEASYRIRGKVSLQQALLQGILFALQKAPPVRQIEVILEDATVAAMIHEGHHARSQGRGQTNHHLVNAILDVAEARARAQGVTLHIVLGWNPANHGALYGLQASRVIARKTLLGASARPHM